SAFNPVLRIEDQFVDTARAHRAGSAATTRRRTRELLDLVRLDPERTARAYPHELSGGMRQRVLIALSLILNPKVLVLDEPTTALDILTQRAVIDLLRDVKREFDLSLVVVSHDLALAAELADRVAAMYAGRIVELAPVEAAFYTPRHPYTVGLIRGVPRIREAEMGFHSIPGSPPDLIQLPAGCPFHERCEWASAECRASDPPVAGIGPGRAVACHRWRQIEADVGVLPLAGARQWGGAPDEPERAGA
ncbi:MAG TPA: ABC transporter ATP-binding protein, partial [Limnochordia bacterium]|nr:ABC transporter ATP-binding protein [Limnochordia bacterium]